MVVPAWYWPPEGGAARGVALVPFGSGVAVADWTTPVLWPFDDGVFSPGIVLATGVAAGLCGAAIDGSFGAWALGYDGTFYRQSSGSVLAAMNMPSGKAYVGCGSNIPGGSGFALASDGTVYRSDGSLLASWPAAAIGMAATGSVLLGLLPSSGIGTMAVPGGATGLIAFPGAIATPSCMAASGGGPIPLGIGGWRTAAALTGMAAAGLDPQAATTMLAVGNGSAVIWQAPAAASEAWSQTQTLGGLANLSAVTWRPDGTQVLAASVAGGVQVIGYAFGVMSLAQSLSIAGACAIAVTADSTNALVAQSGLASLAPLAYGGSTWTIGSAVTGVPGITAVASYGPSGAVATSTGGLTFLELAGGAWGTAGSAAIGFNPFAVAVDPFLNVYAAGSGAMAVVANGILVGSGSWAGGTPTAIVVQQGRAVMAVDGGYRVFGQSTAIPALWIQETSGAWSLGANVGLALSETTLFAMGTSTITRGFSGTPFTLTPVSSGVAAQWSGSSWTVTELGIGHMPSCCGFDASGGFHAATIQNTLWAMASDGTGTSGILPRYPGQTQDVPMGASAIEALNGGLYVATSLPGVLVQVS